jgi:hypothetical protein
MDADGIDPGPIFPFLANYTMVHAKKTGRRREEHGKRQLFMSCNIPNEDSELMGMSDWILRGCW